MGFFFGSSIDKYGCSEAFRWSKRKSKIDAKLGNDGEKDFGEEKQLQQTSMF